MCPCDMGRLSFGHTSARKALAEEKGTKMGALNAENPFNQGLVHRPVTRIWHAS